MSNASAAVILLPTKTRFMIGARSVARRRNVAFERLDQDATVEDRGPRFAKTARYGSAETVGCSHDDGALTLEAHKLAETRQCHVASFGRRFPVPDDLTGGTVRQHPRPARLLFASWRQALPEIGARLR